MAKLNDIAKNLSERETAPENTDNRKNKNERIPIGAPRSRLDVKGKEPGFHYAFINDDEVDERLDQGFEFVTHKVKVGTRRIGATQTEDGSMCVSLPVGAGRTGYLMRIPQELYDQDMKSYHKSIDATEQGISKQSSSNGLQGTVEISRKSQD